MIFPARYTLGLYKHSPVDFENLRAAKYVWKNTDRIFFGVRQLTRVDGATPDARRRGILERTLRCHSPSIDSLPSM